MRPAIRFLEKELIEIILLEARDILCRLGIEIHNGEILALLGDHGADVDLKKNRVCMNKRIIDRALASSPHSFKLFDVNGALTHDFSGANVYFTPGSAALYLLDAETRSQRRPNTADYVRYAKLVSRLPHIASQSTALIPADVPEPISDSYRLYLSLLFCDKPVVTGTFTIESFALMRDLQLAVRGSEAALKEKPLTVFSCCPTSPLKWSDVTSQNVIDCGRYGIPVEFIAMPLSGFVAPVTLVGTLIQHTAETLSGIVISQLAHPGAPILYGGSPAVFDVRYETTPMGDISTQMLDCAYSEIGKHLSLPTQAYISLSDAKELDAQAGLESAMGATLAALAGINNISGPGMLDFESCLSLEKLLLDNEICGMTLHMLKGITPKEDFPSLPLFEELLREKHLLIADHTRRYLKTEHYLPGAVIDRANRARWLEEGGLSLLARAKREVERLVATCRPSSLPVGIRRQLQNLMAAEARRYGLDTLPQLPD